MNVKVLLGSTCSPALHLDIHVFPQLGGFCSYQMMKHKGQPVLHNGALPQRCPLAFGFCRFVSPNQFSRTRLTSTRIHATTAPAHCDCPKPAPAPNATPHKAATPPAPPSAMPNRTPPASCTATHGHRLEHRKPDTDRRRSNRHPHDYKTSRAWVR